MYQKSLLTRLADGALAKKMGWADQILFAARRTHELKGQSLTLSKNSVRLIYSRENGLGEIGSGLSA